MRKEYKRIGNKRIKIFFSCVVVCAVAFSACLGDVDEDVDPLDCEGVSCSGHGDCLLTEEGPVCECDEGYVAQGLVCEEESSDPCGTESIRVEVLEQERVLLSGITLESSEALDALAADPDRFDGQLVQVEGWVVSLCLRGRNSAMLENQTGDQVKIAGDHNADLVQFLELGDYAIFEGIFTRWFCRRGPHVNFGAYGGVAGQVSCPGP